MDLLASLAPFVPLAQTILWIVLVLVLVVWFREKIDAVFRAVQHRIEAGGGVKAGPFELAEMLRAQSPQEQRERAHAEAEEVVRQQASSGSNKPSISIADATSQYLRSEDLALRAIQAEYGVPVQRQVSVGPSNEFDGIFFHERKVYVVEVKFFLGSVNTEKLRISIQRVASAAQRWVGPAARIALVLVFKREEDIAPNEPRAREAIADLKVPAELWVYSLAKLQTQFGVGAGDG